MHANFILLDDDDDDDYETKDQSTAAKQAEMTGHAFPVKLHVS